MVCDVQVEVLTGSTKSPHDTAAVAKNCYIAYVLEIRYSDLFKFPQKELMRLGAYSALVYVAFIVFCSCQVSQQAEFSLIKEKRKLTSVLVRLGWSESKVLERSGTDLEQSCLYNILAVSLLMSFHFSFHAFVLCSLCLVVNLPVISRSLTHPQIGYRESGLKC